MVKFSNLAVREPPSQEAKLPKEVRLCDATEVCAKCGEMAAKFKCSRCHRVCYCTKQCQEKHWPLHKKLCKTLKEQEAGSGQQDFRNRRLFDASIAGDLKTVSSMIAEGADVNSSDSRLQTPLHAASMRGHLPVLNALIAARAVVDRSCAEGKTALMCAAMEGHAAIVDTLHRVAGASVHHVDKFGWTAFHFAAMNATTDSHGNTPLTTASGGNATFKGHPAVVQALIEGGANVNLPRPNGATSLTLASQSGNIEVVRILLAAGANVNHVNQYGASALILAAECGHVEVVRALCAAGANVNHISRHGATALIMATQLRRVEVVRALLEANADPRITNPVNGAAPLGNARHFGPPAMVALLEARLAELYERTRVVPLREGA